MIIRHKNLEVFAWDKEKHCYKYILDKNIGFKLEVGQRLNRVMYDGSNKELYYDVILKDFDSAGITIEKYIHEALADLKPFLDTKWLPWQKIIPNWKGEGELLNLVIEPLDRLFEAVDITKKHDSQIYHKYTGTPHNSRFHKNINNFIKLGQIEMEE
jgi:hypothetical protein